MAYQHYGLGISKNLIQITNDSIVKNLLPDFTFLMKSSVAESIIRLAKRKELNRMRRHKYRPVRSTWR